MSNNMDIDPHSDEYKYGRNDQDIELSRTGFLNLILHAIDIGWARHLLRIIKSKRMAHNIIECPHSRQFQQEHTPLLNARIKHACKALIYGYACEAEINELYKYKDISKIMIDYMGISSADYMTTNTCSENGNWMYLIFSNDSEYNYFYDKEIGLICITNNISQLDLD